ncbi:replication-associated recombination protein A [Mesomycoplasma neurolyticum]|uniref:ATPase n=1 Tax=Mesomycoplasma neurolyticum TaxID=2120 RepID=A0A449A4D0_9BACT|nr:replication-associated recombination protein A [Mesomycoplasma neurolyticum]VEU59105.1 ATPase [Mesomycoplasma neurolyticum]VEU59873.1 ATPase [Mesomycoplasma neurolyticum]
MNNITSKIFVPEKLDDIVGQSHIKFLLKKIIDHKNNTSFIFYGESGIGKTSSAIVLAKELGKKFVIFNSVLDNKEKLINYINNYDIIIIDEIHRLNKDKQDILLSFLEEKNKTFYATTTENPFFKVNPAIRSRLQILQFEKISEEDITNALQKIIKNKKINLIFDKETLEKFVRISSGDLRNVFNNLELLINLKFKGKITIEILEKIFPHKNFYYDYKKDASYDNLSAFHKSVRGSDVDASLYYGLLLVVGGNLDGLFRRMLAIAYEDIGLANSLIGLKVDTAIKAAERLGMPEAILPIGNIIIELALSPKSNSSYLATQKALNTINENKVYQVPKHLKDNHYASAAKLKNGIGYLYPHDFANSYVEQQYMPKELIEEKFFHFKNNANERKIKEYWKQIKEKNNNK